MFNALDKKELATFQKGVDQIYDTFITKIAQNSIAFCMLVQLFMATYWISGYPFDRACRVDSTDAHHRPISLTSRCFPACDQ